MTELALIRHGITAWNTAGRMQGRRDVPLSPAGREALARFRPPPEVAGFAWLSSPLVRAVETAELLSGESPALDPRLVELDWGEWEGLTLDELRAAHPEMAANEERGLDFLPPGGESPRQVQDRIKPLLAELAGGPPRVAVTHKGVMRAIMALAYDWPMRGRPPLKLSRHAVHLFTLEAGGRPRPGGPSVAFGEAHKEGHGEGHGEAT
jgi:probable phosphoglycerate mutase